MGRVSAQTEIMGLNGPGEAVLLGHRFPDPVFSSDIGDHGVKLAHKFRQFLGMEEIGGRGARRFQCAGCEEIICGGAETYCGSCLCAMGVDSANIDSVAHNDSDIGHSGVGPCTAEASGMSGAETPFLFGPTDPMSDGNISAQRDETSGFLAIIACDYKSGMNRLACDLSKSTCGDDMSTSQTNSSICHDVTNIPLDSFTASLETGGVFSKRQKRSHSLMDWSRQPTKSARRLTGPYDSDNKIQASDDMNDKHNLNIGINDMRSPLATCIKINSAPVSTPCIRAELPCSEVNHNINEDVVNNNLPENKTNQDEEDTNENTDNSHNMGNSHSIGNGHNICNSHNVCNSHSIGNTNILCIKSEDNEVCNHSIGPIGSNSVHDHTMVNDGIEKDDEDVKIIGLSLSVGHMGETDTGGKGSIGSYYDVNMVSDKIGTVNALSRQYDTMGVWESNDEYMYSEMYIHGNGDEVVRDNRDDDMYDGRNNYYYNNNRNNEDMMNYGNNENNRNMMRIDNNDTRLLNSDISQSMYMNINNNMFNRQNRYDIVDDSVRINQTRVPGGNRSIGGRKSNNNLNTTSSKEGKKYTTSKYNASKSNKSNNDNTQANGKRETGAYNERGEKVSGVWYDQNRKLWRVMYVDGEKRKTKGFSPKQYGFMEARQLAVKLKYEMANRHRARAQNEENAQGDDA